MRRLLNTIYVTSENSYLSLEGNDLVLKKPDLPKQRITFDNIEGIVCMNYMGCSPALMGKCVDNSVELCFVKPNGNFLAKVCGPTKGNVFTRVKQIDVFREHGIELAKQNIAIKLHNTIKVIKRSMHDNPDLRADEDILNTIKVLEDGEDNITTVNSVEEVMGVEGAGAKAYFSIFGKLLKNSDFSFEFRSKRPPLDPVNSVLSLMYTMWTNNYGSALDTVGLDSYIGFCHSLRSGRKSLACDMVEESRCIIERFTLTMFNMRILEKSDFEREVSGRVTIAKSGWGKIIQQWQAKKRSEIMHPVLHEKIPLGLLPYVQANLLSKYIRGETDKYQPYIVKE